MQKTNKQTKNPLAKFSNLSLIKMEENCVNGPKIAYEKQKGNMPIDERQRAAPLDLECTKLPAFTSSLQHIL